MASFEIKIKGVALCFYTAADLTWNVVLPCDNYHLSELSCNGKRIDLRDEGRAIRIDFPTTSINPGPGSTSSVANLFNLSEPRAHNQTAGKSNLRFRDLIASAHDFVILRMPHATFKTTTPTVCNYFVQEVTPSGQALSPQDLNEKKDREVVFEFSSKEDINLVAKDLRDANFNAPVGQFPAMSIAPHYLEIDNHCNALNCPKENDSLHLYWIVEDPTGKRFQTGQMKCDGAVEAQMAFVAPFMVPYGNCDPAGSNPPPEGTWPQG